MLNYFLAVLIGLLAGISSGLFGVGGGVIIVPLVVGIFGLSQQSGSATGYITPENFKYGGLIACGLLIGTFFGAKLAVHLTSENLAKMFSVYLFAMAIRIWWAAK